MNSYRNPYVMNENTGESSTLSFVKRFLTEFPEMNERASGGAPTPQTPIYENPVTNKTKSYVGRASHIASASNPSEDFWCSKVDVSAACRKLDPLSREILGRTFLRGQTSDQISAVTGLTISGVNGKRAAALRRIAGILDGTCF